MSELNDLAKFISEATGEPCEVEDILHVKRAKEPYSGSPLESVVQPQQDSGVPLNPDVQPTAKPWDWRNTSEEKPNVGWTCWGEDRSGRIQKMFLVEDDRWYHDMLNKPMQYTPVRWCYEILGEQCSLEHEAKDHAAG